MVRIKKGSMLDASEDIIVHQVNCQGKMGRGLAVDIRMKWPVVYDVYKTMCDNTDDKRSLLGQVLIWKVASDGNKNKTIANVFGQCDYGRAKKVYTVYEALKNGLDYIAQMAKREGLTVAIPYGIGCGLGGGDWDGIVLPMILDIFEDVDGVSIYQW